MNLDIAIRGLNTIYNKLDDSKQKKELLKAIQAFESPSKITSHEGALKILNKLIQGGNITGLTLILEFLSTYINSNKEYKNLKASIKFGLNQLRNNVPNNIKKLYRLMFLINIILSILIYIIPIEINIKLKLILILQLVSSTFYFTCQFFGLDIE